MDELFVSWFVTTCGEASVQMHNIPERIVSERSAPGKWSRKEVIGHLIDSATHNQIRFVRAQLQDDLVFSGYDQDAWVRAQRYNDRPWHDLIETWHAYNRQIAAVMRATPSPEALRPRGRHNLDEIAFGTLPAGADATLDFLMRDYVAHLRHHLRQILP
jgi:hypothetical protein